MHAKKIDSQSNIHDRIAGLIDPNMVSFGNKKIDSLRKKANDALNSVQLNEWVDIFGKKFKNYFPDVEKLSISGNEEIKIKKDICDQKEKIGGKNVIGKLMMSNEEIHYWMTPEIEEKGVVLCDLLSAFRDHPEITQHIFSNMRMDRNPIISNLMLAQVSLGSFLYIPDDVQLNGVFMIQADLDEFPNALYLLHLITVIGKSAKGNLIVDIRSNSKKDGQSFFIVQDEIILGDNSKLSIFQNQRIGNRSALFISEQILEGRNAIINDCILDKGSALLDRFVALETDNEGGEAKITTLYTPKNNQHYYYDTLQKHNHSHTISDLLFKGVLGKDTYSIWKGNISVAKGTIGANGYQANNILLVEESAKAESIPGLEILTDDVRCSHGVTMGNIDKNQMFYLQCRGINKEDAEKLIVDGFLLSAIKRVDEKDFEKYIQASLEN